MAASSPRCIQQSLLSDTHHIPVKSFNPSPLSSYDSDLENTSAFLLNKPSDEQSSSSKPRSTHHKLNDIQHLSIQLTQPSTNPFILNHPSSPLSSTNSSPLPPQVDYTKSSHRPWISALLSTKFYGPCPKHSSLRKNDLNLFCTKHAVKICQYCHQANHSQKASAHRCTILHVSRYMYHDVLLAKEAAALLDVSEVQSYLNNGNRVVYIDRRAQPKSKLAPHAKACAVCSRTLQDPYRFCSVFCRLAHAKDPAAVSSLPVPDACPLLQQTARKTKPQVQSPSQSPSKRNERSVKRLDRNSARSPTMSPVTPSRSSVKASTMAPPLQLVPMKKKSRRKGVPVRSLSSAPLCLLLCHGPFTHL